VISWADWRAQAPSPPFAPLAQVLPVLPPKRWPLPQDWNALADLRRLRNARSLPLRFVPTSDGRLSALDFERRIHEAGEVETRADNWHDAFHACAWLLFPRAKARINALHMAAGAADAPNGRTPLRDLLTQFDESGLVIACADAQLAQLLAGFRWHELFWEKRARVQAAMDFVVFGHALYEHCLAPYDGLTAKGIVVPVRADYFTLEGPQRLALLDQALDSHITLLSAQAGPRDLQPLPIKGIPGWARENEDAAYYRDERQFRPGRGKAARSGPPAGAQSPTSE
jgi:hypothetical protein